MIRVLPSSILVRLIQESLDAVLITDSDGRIRYLNPAMEKLCGYESAEILLEPLSRLIDDATAAAQIEFIDRLKGDGESQSAQTRVRELPLRHRTGELIPVELKAVDLGAEVGTHFFGTFMTDLRERKNAEAQRNALLEQLEHLALTDALTGLPNRRAFDLEAERLMAHARREKWPATMGMVDVDWFKRINDQHGHPAGDALLKVVAQKIQQVIRSGDLCGRIGGDEFGLLLPHATLQQAAIVAERIRSVIAEPVRTPDVPAIDVTVSIGLAKLDTSARVETALAHADAALYQAKLTGRNRVIVAQV